MRKITMIVLIMSVCMICTGCGKDETQNDIHKSNEITQNTNTTEQNDIQDELVDNDFQYVDGVTEPVRIDISEEEVRVNVKGNVTSIYKCSGDLITDWYEKYYFDTEEDAQNFANEHPNQSRVSIKDNIVLVDVEMPKDTVMKKSDLLETYSTLKDVYVNEQ